MSSVKQSIQFRSVKAILEYYRESELPCWEISHNKQPIYEYDNDDMTEGENKLEGNLETLKKEGGAGIYALTIFSDQKKRCVGFRFKEYSDEYVPGIVGGASVSNEILSLLRSQETELKELRKRITEMEEEEDDDDNDGLGSIGELLKNPLIAGFLEGLLKQNNTPGQRAATLSGVPGAGIKQTDEQRIEAAIEILKKYDTNLPAHLEKLARIAQNNPPKFKNLIGLLSLY